MEPTYEYVVKIGRWFLARQLPKSGRRGLFIGLSMNGFYATVADFSRSRR